MGLTPIIKEHVKNALDVTPKNLINTTIKNLVVVKVNNLYKFTKFVYKKLTN